jgi:hypothetical protein
MNNKIFYVFCVAVGSLGSMQVIDAVTKTFSRIDYRFTLLENRTRDLETRTVDLYTTTSKLERNMNHLTGRVESLERNDKN